MTLSGNIQAVVCTQRVDRRSERLASCWLSNGEGSAELDIKSLNAAVSTGILQAVRMEEKAGDPAMLGANATLLVLGAAVPPALLETMFWAADAGKRVYVLASPGFGQGDEKAQIDQRRDARILIRRLPNPLPFSAWVANRGKHSCAWLGNAPRRDWNWRLSLTEQQGADLFRLALHLFWHDALDEAWTGDGPLRFREAAERPFDVLPPRPAATVLLLDSVSTSPLPSGEIWHDPQSSLPRSAPWPKIVLVPPSGQGQQTLIPLVRNGTTVFWHELQLPRFSLHSSGGMVEWQGERWRVRLCMSAQQSSAFAKVVAHADAAPLWRFAANIELGAIRDSVLLPDSVAAAALQASAKIPCDDTRAESLHAMESSPPLSFPTPPPLASSVVYTWTVRPPYPPEKAGEDGLVAQWKEIDEKYKGRVEKASTRIARLEQEEGVLSHAFSSLTSALLGLGSERNRIAAQLAGLSKQSPACLGPGATISLLQEMAACEAAVSKLEEGLNEERRSAEEADDRRKQEEAWQNRKKDGEKAMSARHKDLTNAQERLSEVESELGDLSKLPSPPGKRERKDLEARKRKLRDEQKALDSRISRIEQETQGFEAMVESKFEYRPSKRAEVVTTKTPKKGAAFVPTSPSMAADRLPPEALPKLGRLLNHQGTRYLAISRWDELDQAELEAKRLNARLVAARKHE
ncbi:MAG: hypothetical protein WC712_03275 [Candidatus Brocadiia bacterium]